MLTVGTELFFRFACDTQKGALRPAKVLSAVDGVMSAAFEAPEDLKLQPGTEVMVFFTRQNTFMQQPARIELVAVDQPLPTLAFRLEGEPVSAESRECFRICTVIMDLTVQFNGKKNCPLLDVSVDGFAVRSAEDLPVGKSVAVSFVHEGKSYNGNARIQSARQLAPGQFRYGLLCVRDTRNANDLSKGLREVAMTLQRQQARRLRGTG